MPIIWKPTGSLNINTDPTELPEQNDGKSIASGAMVRCKNLRLNRNGIAFTRYGTTRLSSFTASGTPDLLIEAGRHRYIFAGDYIYYDEVETSSTTYIAAPTSNPRSIQPKNRSSNRRDAETQRRRDAKLRKGIS